MSKNQKLAERLEFAAEIVRKDLPFQSRAANESWLRRAPYEITKFTEWGDWMDYEIRLIPEPVKVPLGPEDVPPGSALRISKHAETWELIIATDSLGVYNSDNKLIGWDELESDYEIKRPGEEWKPCHKEGGQA